MVHGKKKRTLKRRIRRFEFDILCKGAYDGGDGPVAMERQSGIDKRKGGRNDS